jgi:molybdopterin-containing oxidoreductase family membrane subunit
MLLYRLTGYNVGRKAIDALAVIVTYAMVLNVFFLSLEIFTAFYSQIPDLMTHFDNLYLGQGPHTTLLPWGRASLVLMVVSLAMLLTPRLRRGHGTLAAACAVTFAALWMDKGICLVVCGFIPSPLGVTSRYVPTFPEVMITLGVFAVGALMITVFYKIALSVEAGAAQHFTYAEEVGSHEESSVYMPATAHAPDVIQ